MKEKGVKCITLVLVAFLFLLEGRGVTFGGDEWFSCQQRDPFRLNCSK